MRVWPLPYFRMASLALKTLLPMMGIFSFPLPVQAHLVLPLNPAKRLDVAICPDSMNRIMVSNDRILQVFGDEGAFESQAEERTGQVFLKPTAENGAKDLSITLVTEQGLTQDLTLKPTAKSPTTLVFKNTSPVDPSPFQHNTQIGPLPPSFSNDQMASLPRELLASLKQALKGKLPLLEGEGLAGISCPTPEGLHVSYQKSYRKGPYSIHVFQVKNTLPTPLEVEEKSFYQAGDLAISLEECVLAVGGATHLYIIRPPSLTRLPETDPWVSQGPTENFAGQTNDD